MINLLNKLQDLLDATRALDFLGPLALRLYLAPVFWYAGTNKVAGFEGVVEWFGNTEWGLGLPMPFVMAVLAVGAEVVGAVFLTIGFAVRWISIPLIITMIVAMATVHWENGWQAVLDAKSPFPPADLEDGVQRLQAAKSLLQEHGNYDWLSGSGSYVISNNGIEWSVTYMVMLIALLFIGGGRYFSVDYWIKKKFRD